MPNLEPTYLRYVYDSLNKGSLNSENAAALPQGFIGLYEQEFTQKTPAGERKKVLNQLALWALFKGPVSANFAAAILELEEEQMKDLVDTYSSWFNSPESGKYQLYHERLRVYLLQKLKAEEVQVLNEKLISILEDAIKQAKGEEDEYYALEHLHQHMALESQLGNHYDRLHSYVNQESLWRRQIQLSKGYAWSQNAVQQGIKEGARRNHEMNTIRSTVNSVKLMTQEQNSAEDILNLLNEGDFQAALKRAESWEGERQFKLYLLFIHELTIGTSKKANFRKEACKAVLEAIDKTPEDRSVLDWCTFYPELAIYRYHEELLKMELDGIVIWKRGNYTLSVLFDSKDVNIGIIKRLVSDVTDVEHKSKTYIQISKILMEQGQKEESLKLASDITHTQLKSEAYRELSKILIEQGHNEESLKVASNITDEKIKTKAYLTISKSFFENGNRIKSFKIINKFQDNFTKSLAYIDIVQILIDVNKKKDARKIVDTVFDLILKIDDYETKSLLYVKILKNLLQLSEINLTKETLNKVLKISKFSNSDAQISRIQCDLCTIMMKIGMEKKAIKIASEIEDDFYLPDAFLNIFKEYLLLDKVDEAISLIKSNYDLIFWKISSSIVLELSKVNKINEAIQFADSLDEFDGFEAYKNIYMFVEKPAHKIEIILKELAKNKRLHINVINLFINYNKEKIFKSLILNSLKIQQKYSVDFPDLKLCNVLIDCGAENLALKLSSEHISRFIKKQNKYSFDENEMTEIIEFLINNNNYNLEPTLKFISNIETFNIIPSRQSKGYLVVSKILAEALKNQNFKHVTLKIEDDNLFAEAYSYFTLQLFKQNKFEESIEQINNIKNDFHLSNSYINILSLLTLKSSKKIIKRVISESQTTVLKLERDEPKINLFTEISFALIRLGYEDALAINIINNIKFINSINYDRTKFKAYLKLSEILFKNNQKEKSLELIKNAISLAKNFTSQNANYIGTKLVFEDKPNYYDISHAYYDICKILVDQFHVEEALYFANEINAFNYSIIEILKYKPYLYVYEILSLRGEKKQLQKILNEIINCVFKISNELYRDSACEITSKVLVKLKHFEKVSKFAFIIKDQNKKKGVFRNLAKALINQKNIRKSDHNIKAINDILFRTEFYLEKTKFFFEHKKLKHSIITAEKVHALKQRYSLLEYLGRKFPYNKSKSLLLFIKSKDNKNAFVKGLSEKIKEQMEASKSVTPYLYTFSEHTQYLHNILFHQAKIACFFEEERNEEKLDMLSEVLDLKDWRRISARA